MFHKSNMFNKAVSERWCMDSNMEISLDPNKNVQNEVVDFFCTYIVKQLYDVLLIGESHTLSNFIKIIKLVKRLFKGFHMKDK